MLIHFSFLRVNPGKQLSQLLDEEHKRHPSVEFVIPHYKHSPVIVNVCPKEQDRQISDLVLYSYLQFSHPAGQARHS